MNAWIERISRQRVSGGGRARYRRMRREQRAFRLQSIRKIVGIASAGLPRDEDAAWRIELFVVYLLADFHGFGAGAALLASVLNDSPAALWVADPNPRAQAFYRKHGFEPDGAVQDHGIPEIRMIRGLPTYRASIR